MLVSCPVRCMAGEGDIVPVRQVPAGPDGAVPYGIDNGAREEAPSLLRQET